MTAMANEGGHETAYERGFRHGGQQGGGDNPGRGAGPSFLNRQLGPLPLWTWLVLFLFGALGYYLWSKHAAANSTSSTTNTSTGTSTTDSSLIPQFVNQTYVQNAPPELGTGTTTSGTGGNTGTTKSAPGYGEAGPDQKGFTAITLTQAQTLLSSKNAFNPSGQKSQRPFIWNGSSYVPATLIKSGYQYYAGPLETTEITNAAKKGGKGGKVAH